MEPQEEASSADTSRKWILVIAVLFLAACFLVVWTTTEEPAFVVRADNKTDEVNDTVERFTISIKANEDLGSGQVNFTIRNGDDLVLDAGERSIEDHRSGEKETLEFDMDVGTDDERPRIIKIVLQLRYPGSDKEEEYEFVYKKEVGGGRYWKET